MCLYIYRRSVTGLNVNTTGGTVHWESHISTGTASTLSTAPANTITASVTTSVTSRVVCTTEGTVKYIRIAIHLAITTVTVYTTMGCVMRPVTSRNVTGTVVIVRKKQLLDLLLRVP